MSEPLTDKELERERRYALEGHEAFAHITLRILDTIADLQARLQTAKETLAIRGLDAEAIKQGLEARLRESEAHMGEAWQEYRRLWLRWFDERVEKKYTRQRYRRTQADLAACQVALENQEPWLAAIGRMLVEHKIVRFPDDVLAWRNERDAALALLREAREALKGRCCTVEIDRRGNVTHEQGCLLPRIRKIVGTE